MAPRLRTSDRLKEKADAGNNSDAAAAAAAVPMANDVDVDIEVDDPADDILEATLGELNSLSPALEDPVHERLLDLWTRLSDGFEHAQSGPSPPEPALFGHWALLNIQPTVLDAVCRQRWDESHEVLISKHDAKFRGRVLSLAKAYKLPSHLHLWLLFEPQTEAVISRQGITALQALCMNRPDVSLANVADQLHTRIQAQVPKRKQRSAIFHLRGVVESYDDKNLHLWPTDPKTTMKKENEGESPEARQASIHSQRDHHDDGSHSLREASPLLLSPSRKPVEKPQSQGPAQERVLPSTQQVGVGLGHTSGNYTDGRLEVDLDKGPINNGLNGTFSPSREPSPASVRSSPNEASEIFSQLELGRQHDEAASPTEDTSFFETEFGYVDDDDLDPDGAQQLFTEMEASVTQSEPIAPAFRPSGSETRPGSPIAEQEHEDKPKTQHNTASTIQPQSPRQIPSSPEGNNPNTSFQHAITRKRPAEEPVLDSDQTEHRSVKKSCGDTRLSEDSVHREKRPPRPETRVGGASKTSTLQLPGHRDKDNKQATDLNAKDALDPFSARRKQMSGAPRRPSLEQLSHDAPGLDEGSYVSDKIVQTLTQRISSDSTLVVSSLALIADQANLRRRTYARFFAADYILFPTHSRVQKHWRLYRWVKADAALEKYDSISKLNDAETASTVVKFLAWLFEDEALADIRPMAKPCPQQPNAYDCGIYTIEFALRLATQTSVITKFDVSALRRCFRDQIFTSDAATLPVACYRQYGTSAFSTAYLVELTTRTCTRLNHFRKLQESYMPTDRIKGQIENLMALERCQLAEASTAASLSRLHALHTASLATARRAEEDYKDEVRKAKLRSDAVALLLQASSGPRDRFDDTYDLALGTLESAARTFAALGEEGEKRGSRRVEMVRSAH